MADSNSTLPTGRALGVLKVAARKAGVSFEEYQLRRAGGQKWCLRCKCWHPVARFGLDASRYDGLNASCGLGRRRFHADTYVATPEDQRKPMGPPAHAPRAGDKAQARHYINLQVRKGMRPHPNLLPCTDCGHNWIPHQKRHEYDHHLGYAAEHHGDVQPVCTRCHAARERARSLAA